MITITYKEASKLINLLGKNGFHKIAYELEKELDKREIQIGELKTIQYCEHDWNDSWMKDRRVMSGFPDIDERKDREDIINYLTNQCRYCNKCKITYGMRNYDYKTITEEYRKEFSINISIAGIRWFSYIDKKGIDEYTSIEKKIEKIKDEMGKLKQGNSSKNVKELENELEELNKQIVKYD